MHTQKTIGVRILKSEQVKWRDLQFIQQDNFKDISDEAKLKLKTSLLTNEFIQPFYVWQDPSDQVIYCLDGKHRTLFMEELINTGIEIPDLLPAVFLNCADKSEAAKLVLIYSSVYAKLTEAGFHSFVEEYQLSMDELAGQINLPDIKFEIRTPDKLLIMQEDDFDVDEEIRKIIAAKSKAGDAFLLGGHLLICGDSKNLDQYQDILIGRRAKVIYCDPPYNISYNYEKGLGATKKQYTNQKFSDNLTDGDYSNLIYSTLNNGLKYSELDVHVFYWCDEKYIGLIQAQFERNSVVNRRTCFWIKERLNPVPQVAFNKVIEPCVYGTIGQPALNPEFTNLTEVWNTDMLASHSLDELMSLAQLWFVRRDDTNQYEHPTTKPILLHEKPLKRCSVQGDTIMDLFGGSGSTLISCEQLGRKAILVEKDPVFCDVIIRRYVNYCNKAGKPIKFKHINGKLTLDHIFKTEAVS
jgi:DNA modification methylase